LYLRVYWGDVCAVCWGRCSLVGVQVMSIVVFRPIAFQFPVDEGLPIHLQFVSVFALRLVLVL